MSVSGRANNDNVRWEVKSLLAGAVKCEQRHLSRDLQLQNNLYTNCICSSHIPILLLL